MKKSNNIVIITSGYPNPKDPTNLTFVDQLACSFADLGKNVQVISPTPIWDKNKFFKSKWSRVTSQGNTVSVYHPRYISYSNRKLLGINSYYMTYRSFREAVSKQLVNMESPPEVVYAHFLVPSGCVAAEISKDLGIPAFAAFGESSLWSVNNLGISKVKKRLEDLSGIVSVSSENKNVLIDQNIFQAEKIGVFPNGIDSTLFYPRDRRDMRKKYGISEDKFIGVFTGSFIDRKGSLRVQQAIEGLKNIGMIYIGSGEKEPQGDNIIFKGRVPHALVPEYLSAADFFILPTRNEGCSNAIIEAMACGLPIISSNRPFNAEILNADNAELIEPDDIGAIRNSILQLQCNPERRTAMSKASYRKAQKLDILSRAYNILNFMECSITNNVQNEESK